MLTIVDIGASAGGLEAFSSLLRGLPPNPGIALIFLQHLAPQHESALVTLLSPQSGLPVVQATDGLRIEPNRVYVIPLELPLAAHRTRARRHVQLLCRPRKNHASGQREYLTAMLDITERKRLEDDRARAAQDRAALASRLISIQDEERHRIARDLHDNIGQHVTALRLKLAGIAAGGSASVQERIEEADRLVSELDRHLEFIARELRPAALDLGIATALRQFVSEWSRTFGIAAEFHAAGFSEARLSPSSETHLYRVTQEALNNVYKHAQATSVSVLLENRGGDVVLIVEDNGTGFDPKRVRGDADTLGLVGMRERAEIIGGALDVESEPGKGTTIFLRIPESSQR